MIASKRRESACVDDTRNTTPLSLCFGPPVNHFVKVQVVNLIPTDYHNPTINPLHRRCLVTLPVLVKMCIEAMGTVIELDQYLMR